MGSSKEVLAFAELLLAAAADSRRWSACLGHAARMFVSRGAQLLQASAADPQRGHRFEATVGLSGFTGRRRGLLYRLMDRDPRDPSNADASWHPGTPGPVPPEVVAGWRDGIPYTCRMFVADHDLRRSPIYRRVLRPCGVEWALATQFRDDDGDRTTFTLYRGPGETAFGDEERAFLGRLVPLIQQAAALNRRTLRHDVERRAALRSLDEVRAGMVLLEAGGRIVFANRPARAVARAGDGVAFEEGRIALADPAARRALAAALAGAAGPRSAPGTVAPPATFAIERANARPAYVATLTPLPPERSPRPLGPHEPPLAVLVLIDPAREVESAQGVLGTLYGLTPAEGRVVDQLLRGRGQAEAAAALSLSVNTVKAHLRGIYRKTRTARQAELVSVVRAALGALH